MTKAHGFSAVELLIALFIAAAFLATGYRLYAVVIQSNGDAQMRAKASAIAYEYVEKYAATAPTTCSTASLLTESKTITGLGPIRTVVTRSCPTGTPSISKIQAVTTYDGSEEVAHAIYAKQ